MGLVVSGSRVARVVLTRCLAQEKLAQSHWKPELQATKATREQQDQEFKNTGELTWQIYNNSKIQS
jgi:hypothetical protein